MGGGRAEGDLRSYVVIKSGNLAEPAHADGTAYECEKGAREG